ncbi:MAG: TetR/AcrR family transcriptional regulator [Deltaproteobacteria bacterium]|nr:TetR/AcrR family transcriptional regulator [Deltaproteobacteria bacterium]
MSIDPFLNAEKTDEGVEPPQASIPKERPGPKGGRRDLNRRERVRTLCEAAEVLFLSQGIENTTIDDITKAASVAKGSFYRYFDGKEALVAHIFDPFATHINDVLTTCGEALKIAKSQAEMNASYEVLASALGELFLTKMELTRLYLQENRAAYSPARAPIKALNDLVTRQAIDLTEKAHLHGILRPFPAAVSAMAVIGTVERLILAILNDEDIGEVLEIPGAIISLILDGLIFRPGETPLYPEAEG